MNASSSTSVGDSENKVGGEQTPFVPLPVEKIEPIDSVMLLPNGTIQVIRNKNSSASSLHLELSKDGGAMWTEVQLKNGQLTGLEDGLTYVLRSRETGKSFLVNIPKLNNDKEDNDIPDKSEEMGGCVHNGKNRALGKLIIILKISCFKLF